MAATAVEAFIPQPAKRGIATTADGPRSRSRPEPAEAFRDTLKAARAKPSAKPAEPQAAKAETRRADADRSRATNDSNDARRPAAAEKGNGRAEASEAVEAADDANKLAAEAPTDTDAAPGEPSPSDGPDRNANQNAEQSAGQPTAEANPTAAQAEAPAGPAIQAPADLHDEPTVAQRPTMSPGQQPAVAQAQPQTAEAQTLAADVTKPTAIADANPADVTNATSAAGRAATGQPSADDAAEPTAERPAGSQTAVGQQAAATAAARPAGTAGEQQSVPVAQADEATAAAAKPTQDPAARQPAGKPASIFNPQNATAAEGQPDGQREAGQEQANQQQGRSPLQQQAAAAAANAQAGVAPESASKSATLPESKLETKADIATAPGTTGPRLAGGTEAAKTQALPPEQRFAADNTDKIVSGVRGRLLPGGGTMQIRLDPPELGAMNVTVKVVNGQVTAEFQTATAAAAKLLSHSLNHLKASLETGGMTVDKIQVRHVPDANISRDAGSNGQQRDGGFDQGSQQSEQHRKEMVKRMWAKLGVTDGVDMVA
ncbi:MAG: flagellar hook-length control protein FliK [Phycisphaerae bacterium]